MIDVKELHSIQIGLASPEKILEWSHGEVTKPETIIYRTLKAETDGLFCEKIFGPTKDWECKCGKYKKMRYAGTICDKCGVEVTSSRVRRVRMGHIALAAPVSHIWYFKGSPSPIGLLLDITPRDLERVLYFAAYIVLDPGRTILYKKQILNEQEYQEAVYTYGKKAFKAQMGAEAIQALLKELDLPQLEIALKKEIEEGSGQRKVKCIRRLEEVQAFLHSGNKPEWMILTVLPVIPPDLRPMVQLDGGRFATSDLNDLYRRVINRNNRTRRLMELGAPEIIIRNEKRMLQEAVDALIDNGKRGRAVSGPGGRPLKSLSDMISGKEGRFRQNLLGKRVDYSGQTVIVVDPELKMYQCALPKEMAVELFKPFIMHKFITMGIACNKKAARKKVDNLSPEVWEVLDDVVKDHPILLHRFPSLNRLGIQAFEPILWDGRAIKISPLVCPGFNAGFNGDVMQCHLPLSEEAQLESRILMLSSGNILDPKNGKPVAIPFQDMVLGCYYLTLGNSAQNIKNIDSSKLHAYSGYDEVMLAYELHKIQLHDFIKVYIPKEECPDGFNQNKVTFVITTPGRLIFNHAIPRELRFFYTWIENRFDGNGKIHKTINTGLGLTIDKKRMTKLVDDCFKKLGNDKTVTLLENIKRLGLHYATISGVSIGIHDLVIPKEKECIIQNGEKQVEKVRNAFVRGLITADEKDKSYVSIWNKANKELDTAVDKAMEKTNPLTMIVHSGARGQRYHIHKMTGMYGFAKDLEGKTIKLTAKNSLKEGMSVLDFFNFSHKARRGVMDISMHSPEAGYLTRRLIDAAQDIIIREEDCDVETLDFDKEQVIFASKPEVKKTIMRLKEVLVGAMLYENVFDRRNGNILLYEGDTIDADDLTLINHHLVETITVIPPTAETPQMFNLGTIDAVAEYNRAMRHHLTVHFAGKKLEEDVLDRQGHLVLTAGTIIDEEAAEKILSSDIPVIRVRMDQAEGVEVSLIEEKGQPIESLADRIAGRCPLEDVVNPTTGEIIAKKNEEISDSQAEEIQKYYDKLKVRSILTCHSAHGVCAKCYGRNLATGRHVEIGEAVGIIAAQSIGEPGTQLTMRTFHTGGVASAEDITQGLPRVEELFEARKPKGNAIISRIDGVVSISSAEDNPNVKVITITPQDPEVEAESEKIPVAKKISVQDGEFIKAGTRLFEGNVNPHDILDVLGVQATQNYIVKEVQKVYRSQGVEINDKHIEVIVHQMLRKIKITEPGDSGWLPGETVDIVAFRATNERLDDEGREKALGENLLLGTTKAALATDSFLSAASFQETTRVLTEAAIKGKEDPLLGLKENVIIGKLIPAGTGMSRYRKLKVVHNTEQLDNDAE